MLRAWFQEQEPAVRIAVITALGGVATAVVTAVGVVLAAVVAALP
jgi:hypothetical protein